MVLAHISRAPRSDAAAFVVVILLGMGVPESARAQGSGRLLWEGSTAAKGYAATVDGVRRDLGLTPLDANGRCGCSLVPWFLGARHEVVISAYNDDGETPAAAPFVVGPTAVTGGPYAGTAGSAVSVSGAASHDVTGTITRYEWRWGDGQTSVGTVATASHSYAAAGVYVAQLTVTDSDGASHASSVNITITAPPVTPGTPAPITPSADASGEPSPSLVLAWTAERATSFDVYFGTTDTPPLVSAGQVLATYTATSLASGTTYRWRIVARNADGSTTGPLWRFTTAVDTTSGLVAAYGFAEGTGTTTADASGQNHVGTLLQGAAWTAGQHGGAVALNGTTAHVSLQNPAGLQLTTSMTVAAWVRETASTRRDAPIVAKSDGQQGWQLTANGNAGARRVTFTVTGPDGRSVHRQGATRIVTGRWYHVVGVYDHVTRRLDLYVDGVLDNGGLRGTVPAAQRDAAVPATVGRRGDGVHLGGAVDDVRIYRRALIGPEVAAVRATPVR